jgi:hypothetical protein
VRRPADDHAFSAFGETVGEWINDAKGVRRVLFNLPNVIAAVKRGETIYVAEGEKDACNLGLFAGVTATCNPFGAGQWRDEYSEVLRGANVVVVADRDDAGVEHARAVAASLEGIASSVRVVKPAIDKDKADASDHLEAGLGLHDFIGLDDDQEHDKPRRLVTGGSFLFDDSPDPEPIWGDGAEVLQAKDEGRMTTGPQGVGKTTTEQQYVLHRIGLRTGKLLGYSVQQAPGKVLYLALDRPAQIRRSFRRMLTPEEFDYLQEHLLFWKGPLEFDVTKDHKALADFAENTGIGYRC